MKIWKWFLRSQKKIDLSSAFWKNQYIWKQMTWFSLGNVVYKTVTTTNTITQVLFTTNNHMRQPIIVIRRNEVYLWRKSRTRVKMKESKFRKHFLPVAMSVFPHYAAIKRFDFSHLNKQEINCLKPKSQLSQENSNRKSTTLTADDCL